MQETMHLMTVKYMWLFK